MTTAIRFEHVSKRYKLGLTRTSLPSAISQWTRHSLKRDPQKSPKDQFIWALKGVSFELAHGHSLALIGPNGAGKTTILKLLANITKPTSGKIDIEGRLSALIELGAGFHPDLTGRENIFLNGTILGLKRTEIERRFDEIVAFSEMERFIDTPVKRYSSGMNVRLGFAIAACIEPEILLVDEVLAVGDASFRQKCLKRIQTLLNHGTSLIFVSHNLYMVQAVCREAIYITNGKIKQIGQTNQVIDAYERDLHQARARKFEISESIHGDPNSESDIEITKVEMLGSDGLMVDSFSSHQPAQIRIHYAAYADLGKVNLAASITRADGLICCMMRTKLDDFDLQVQRGSGVVSVYLEPLQLITGTYFVEAAFLNESDSIALTSQVGRSDWFSIKGEALSYEERSGIYEPMARWQHQNQISESAGTSEIWANASN